jgi:hypothetical protein
MMRLLYEAAYFESGPSPPRSRPVAWGMVVDVRKGKLT